MLIIITKQFNYPDPAQFLHRSGYSVFLGGRHYNPSLRLFVKVNINR